MRFLLRRIRKCRAPFRVPFFCGSRFFWAPLYFEAAGGQQYFISCAKITIYIERGGGFVVRFAFTFLAALAVTFILTPAVKNFAVQIGAVDKAGRTEGASRTGPPFGRACHHTHGLWYPSILTVGFTYEMTGIMIGATCLVFVGIADDIVSLPPR